MAKRLVISSALCLLWLMLANGASGSSGGPLGEQNNYSTAQVVPRIRRDVVQQVEQMSSTIEPSTPEEEDNSSPNNALQDFGMWKTLNFVKRAPNGFIGMRGKKEYDFRSNDLDWANELAGNQFEDSAGDETYGFEGAAGGRRIKKAPTAFYGVRGKKYSNLGSGSGTRGDLNRLNEFLLQLEEEHLRQTLLQDFIGRLATATAAQNEIAKRAPTGFTGMRGKRPAGIDYEEEEMEKRAPANAFVGVRGKKDVYHQTYKRSPHTEKSFNARGKNQRFVDFSNKFVAVRGKKTVGSDLSAQFSDEAGAEDIYGGLAQPRYLINMLPVSPYDANNKRTPNGFMGMRGKRAVPAAAISAVAGTDANDDAAPLERSE